MNISFHFKNFDPSDHLKEYSRSRFEKLSKYIGQDEESEVQVTLCVEKFRQMAEVVFLADSVNLSAYQESEDMYSSIDLVLDKLEAQLRKMREKMKSKRRTQKVVRGVRHNVFTMPSAESGQGRSIVSSDTYEPKPMSVEEAAMQLDSAGMEFLVFRNAETEGLNVIYKLKNGDFGVIDPGY
ncbi:MAG: putative sigma-54 modulation protein [Desulfovibrionales bacterium]|jgi:putative sigma-54 modulation protein|nr:putative sigma-54 modulation protein [Desulfovibrionales bacterium]